MQRCAIPSDHTPIGLHISPDDNYFHLDACRKRCAPKSIGWTIDDNDWTQWTQAVREKVTDKSTVDSDFQDITKRLQEISHLGRGRRTIIKGTSTTEENLNAAIEGTLDDDDARQRLQHQKFKNCDFIQRDKQSSKWRHVLRNLRGGGWGKKAMGNGLLDMRRLRIDDTTRTTDNQEIRAAATRY